MFNNKSGDCLDVVLEENIMLAKLNSIERIEWAIKKFKDKIVFTTSGGETSSLLLKLLSDSLKKVPSFKPTIIFIDTGYYPEETIERINLFRSNGYNIDVYKPLISKEEIENKYPGWQNEGSEYFETVKAIIKHEPLNRAFRKYKPRLWINGLMGYKSGERKKLNFIEFKNGIYMLRPLLDWSEEQVENYMSENKLSYNYAHTDLTKGVNQDCECGIHLHCGLK